MSRKVFTLAMPISGSKIVGQIMICINLLRAGYKPDVILGSSGGCITGMLLLACDINSIVDEESMEGFELKLKKILCQLSSENYCKPWICLPMLDTLLGISCGCGFNRGTGAVFIDPAKIDLSQQPEMWIGTHDSKDKTSQIFCTKRGSETILKFEDAIYLKENIPEILKAATASSAVPMIVPGVKIGGRVYQDGGMSHASPLGDMIHNNVFEESNASYHVVYVSPLRYNKKDDPHETELEDDDIWNRLTAGTGGMITGLHIPDRNNGIREVRIFAEKCGLEVMKQKGEGIKALKECLEMQKKVDCSFIEIAPKGHVTVNFLNMRKGDVFKETKNSYKEGFSVRHWYAI